MTPRSGRFRRSDRLQRSREFQWVSRHGDRCASRYFVVLIAPASSSSDSAEEDRIVAMRAREAEFEADHRAAAASTRPIRAASPRLGVTVSRRVGNAVVRNRIKRRVREWFRGGRERLPAGVDLVVIARRAARELDSKGIVRELDQLLASNDGGRKASGNRHEDRK